MVGNLHSSTQAKAFLTRLARDTRGNTLAIMTAALIPLAGMVGGGVDISRMYIVKTRLQHACDAGALAGRKAMGGGTWAQGSFMPRDSAERFFEANYNRQAYGVTTVTRTFSENAGKVSGTASAVLPMTLMRIFGHQSETLTVTCDAEMRLPNTDVMFVLDTTGSMGETMPGDTRTKNASLKIAVKCFYEIVARLNTDADCNGTPSGGTGDQVQIRFGFVPYATNVNVGKLLKPEWFADSWKYQTREAVWQNAAYTWVQRGDPTITGTETLTVTNVPQGSCSPAAAASAGYNSTKDTLSNSNTVKTTDAKTVTSTSWTSASNGTCTGIRTATQTIYDWKAGQAFKEWTYDQLSVNVGLLKNGNEWNPSFQWPIAANGTDKTIRWDGCIEERKTVRTTNYNPIPTSPEKAYDLDLDLVPEAGNDDTRWGMVLPDLIYTRSGKNGWTRNPVNTTGDFGNGSAYACPLEARKLQKWTDPDLFEDYVDLLNTSGNTYHDIGLIWGGRLMSPSGIFKDDNEYTSKGGEIERHLIFMTDGDACTAVGNYTAYGVAWYDRRQTDVNAVPSDGCTYNDRTLTQQVNLRTEALCREIQTKRITLWVIALGNLATETSTRLQACATPGKYFKPERAEDLIDTFKQIANQISQLRLTR